MDSWYAYKLALKKLEEDNDAPEITLDRRDAPTVTGRLSGTQELGCFVEQKAKNPDQVNCIFIAYSDIRGISRVDWDFEAIS